jgi:hypothetical protein
MLTDIVVDTNVFLHADNLQEPRREHSRILLNILKACSTKLASSLFAVGWVTRR